MCGVYWFAIEELWLKPPPMVDVKVDCGGSQAFHLPFLLTSSWLWRVFFLGDDRLVVVGIWTRLESSML